MLLGCGDADPNILNLVLELKKLGLEHDLNIVAPKVYPGHDHTVFVQPHGEGTQWTDLRAFVGGVLAPVDGGGAAIDLAIGLKTSASGPV